MVSSKNKASSKSGSSSRSSTSTTSVRLSKEQKSDSSYDYANAVKRARKMLRQYPTKDVIIQDFSNDKGLPEELRYNFIFKDKPANRTNMIINESDIKDIQFKIDYNPDKQYYTSNGKKLKKKDINMIIDAKDKRIDKLIKANDRSWSLIDQDRELLTLSNIANTKQSNRIIALRHKIHEYRDEMNF